MRARKIDSNQPALVEQMRRIGMSVFVTSMVGNGFPDLIVGWRGKNLMLELKNPDHPPSKRKLTEDEQHFFDTWKGTVHKVETIDDVLKIINN